MRKMLISLITVSVFICFAAMPAVADWYEGEPYKMHYPQLPDYTYWGLDVNATWPMVLADDFLCTETGWIKDIHFWGSWRHDDEGWVDSFLVSIHANDPGPPSMPVMPPLWEQVITNYMIRPVDPFDYEGWYDPFTGDYFPGDHWMYHQINIFLPEDMWFYQQEGTIYWLNVSAFVDSLQYTRWGWKTSIEPQFMDDAVWAVVPDYFWHELYHPEEPQSLDLAFVITGDTIPPFADTCLTCTMDIRPDLVPCDNSVPIQFEITVTNCGNVAVPVYAEIYPTIGDCPTGFSFDFNINKQLTPNLIPGATFNGYYHYYGGDRCGMGLSLVAIWVDVGPAVNNWFASCCDEFHFTDPFSRYAGPPKGYWGGEGTMFYEVDPTEVIPSATELGQNYPNPFNATTIIPFELAESGNVSLKVYNLAGQLVETLVDGYMDAGYHSVDWSAYAYSSGVYFYKLQTTDNVITKKMNLVK